MAEAQVSSLSKATARLCPARTRTLGLVIRKSDDLRIAPQRQLEFMCAKTIKLVKVSNCVDVNIIAMLGLYVRGIA